MGYDRMKQKIKKSYPSLPIGPFFFSVLVVFGKAFERLKERRVEREGWRGEGAIKPCQVGA